MDDEIFSDSRHLTFQILLASTADQLRLLRFELRILRLFNDICLPHITYNVNKRHVAVWNHIVPQYFVYCKPIRLAMLATGCLTLMCLIGVQKVIEDDMSEAALALRLEATCDRFEVQRIFADERLFNDDPRDVNLFRRTSELVSETISGAMESIKHLELLKLTPQERTLHLVGAQIGNALLFGFLALQPWKLVPLVHFPQGDEDRKADLLGLAMSMKSVAIEHMLDLKASDVGELYQNDEFWLIPRRKIVIVDQLLQQMNEYFGAISFFDLDQEASTKVRAYNECLLMLQKLCVSAVVYNYPVGVFRWLLLIGPEFTEYVRAQEPFAMRLLFVYSCLCLYYRFWLFEQSIWKDYAVYFRAHHGPLCEFDERLYHYVVTRKKYLLDENYRGIKDFDVWSSEFDYQFEG